jgi:hypothetical protein
MNISQEMTTKKVSTNWWIDHENLVYI